MAPGAVAADRKPAQPYGEDVQQQKADDELRRKYFAYAEPVLGAARAAHIERLVHGLASERGRDGLWDELHDPRYRAAGRFIATGNELK